MQLFRKAVFSAPISFFVLASLRQAVRFTCFAAASLATCPGLGAGVAGVAAVVAALVAAVVATLVAVDVGAPVAAGVAAGGVTG
jgi:hypothetical protein